MTILVKTELTPVPLVISRFVAYSEIVSDHEAILPVLPTITLDAIN
ncbi:MAG: hypothetical protein AAFN00_06520 [Cyanobacteria bacterium J06558_2]